MLLAPDQNDSQFQIQSFEPGRIQVNRQWLEHSILIQAGSCEALSANKLSELSPEDLQPILAWSPEILLLGTGPSMKIPPAHLLVDFYEKRIGIEYMNSHAACGAFHVLTAENRKVAAVVLVR